MLLLTVLNYVISALTVLMLLMTVFMFYHSTDSVNIYCHPYVTVQLLLLTVLIL